MARNDEEQFKVNALTVLTIMFFLFCVFWLFVQCAGDVCAANVWDDNFESYGHDVNLNGNDNWSATAPDYQVIDYGAKTGTNCVSIQTTSANSAVKTFSATSTGIVSFYFKIDSGDVPVNYFYLLDSSNNILSYLYIYCETDVLTVLAKDGASSWGYMKNLTDCDIYHLFEVKFDSPNKRYKVQNDAYTWSDWLDYYTDTDNDVSKLKFVANQINHQLYFDDIAGVIVPSDCGDYTGEEFCNESEFGCYWDFGDSTCKSAIGINCDDYLDKTTCTTYSCYWYNSLCHSTAASNCTVYTDFPSCWAETSCCWNYNNTCFDCDNTDLCQNTLLGCYYCLGETSCEEKGCYWDSLNTACLFGASECNPFNFPSCTNQNDCENVGGTWYGGVCTAGTNVPITSWDDYYNDHGTGKSPSGIVEDIASVFQSFLDKLGVYILSFNNTFNPATASQYGASLGSIIPEARGFLVPIDDFLGQGLPVAEIIIFCLLILVGITVFRAIARIWHSIRG